MRVGCLSGAGRVHGGGEAEGGGGDGVRPSAGALKRELALAGFSLLNLYINSQKDYPVSIF